MLTFLSIKNFLLFKKVEINFSPKLNILTGETGAGKSIIIDAINIAFGESFSPNLIFHGEESGSILLEFSISEQQKELLQLLSNHDINHDGSIIIRREMPIKGRSRSRINDTVVTSNLLNSIKEFLLVIQGQFDPQGLLSLNKHRDLLDAYGSIDQQKLKKSYLSWQTLNKEMIELESSLADIENTKETLLFNLKEIENLSPKSNEVEELENKIPSLKKANNTLERFHQVFNILDEEALPLLDKALSIIDHPDISEYNSELIQLLFSGREDTFASMEKIKTEAENLILEVENLPMLEDRLYGLRDIARKHKVQPSQLPNLITEIKQKLYNLKDIEQEKITLKQREAQSRKEYTEIATSISHKRENTARKLEEKINAELLHLGMEKARFVVKLTEIAQNNWDHNGREQVSFQLSTSPNQPPQELSKVASGGELNRLLLAIQSGLAETNNATSIIFDEIDSGIGGKNADALGSRLLFLSNHSQILAITHAPQVAAYGHSHFLVEKNTLNTETSLSFLNQKQKIEEIARMISASSINDSARKAAKKLLHDAQGLILRPNSKINSKN